MKTDKTYAILVNRRQVKLSDYGTFQASIVQVEDNGGLRNPDSDHEFSDLVFSCQWDTTKSDPTYAWAISYRDIYRVDLHNAERMFKTLRKVSTLGKRFPVEPTTFGQFVALSARALGIKTGRKESRRSAGSSSYSENSYIELSLSDVQFSIDEIISETRVSKEVQA
jgi:hypothetical protein